MKYAPKVVDQVFVTRATDTAISLQKDLIKRALEAVTDPRHTERREQSLCVRCYYIYPDRIGGSAMTTQPCGICGLDQTYPNTNTDVLCLHCAKEHLLCKHCAADVLLRPRRKYPFVEKTR